MTGPREQPATVLVYAGLELLGDGLMKLPFVRALRNSYPQAHITWLAGKGKSAYAGKLSPLVRGLLDEVIDDAGIGRHWREILRRPLPDRHFDLILDTQRRAVTTLVLRRIRHSRFVSACAGYLWSDLRPPGALFGAYRKPPALVDQLLELLALARHGRPDAALDCGGQIALPEAVRAEARRLLPEGARYVAMAPGAGERIKCWPLEHFAALGQRLAEQGLVPVYLLGPQETEWHEPLRAAVPQARFPLAEPGARLDLEPVLTIGLAARAAACVANDSGSGHLFAVAASPLICLFGPSAPEKFAPRTVRLTIVKAQDFDSAELRAIPVEAVARAVRAALS